MMNRILLLLFILVCGVASANEETNKTDAAIAFGNIYEHAIWGRDQNGQPISGAGSTLEEGLPFIQYLQEFLDENPDVHSVIDIGCGDWVLAREVNWGEREYLGVDVVEWLIAKNQKEFGRDNIQFQHLDAITEDLPPADLLICKDVLQHTPNATVSELFNKFGNFKYCIFVNDVSSIWETRPNNIDTPLGGFRPIDLTSPPFSLKTKKVFYYESGNTLKQVVLIKRDCWQCD